MTGENCKHCAISGAERAWAVLTTVCCLYLLLAMPCPAMAELMTADEVVNVRAQPGLCAPRVCRLMPGDAVLARDSVGGWRAVADLSGRPMGHVHAPLLKPPGKDASGRPMTVDTVVNVRAGRGTNTDRVARLVPGRAVLASDNRDGWCAVADASGSPMGFAHAQLLRPVATLTAQADPEKHAPEKKAAPPGPAGPGGWQITVTPSIAQALAYDDNVFFKDMADMESRTSPGLQLEAEDERTTLTASAGLDAFRYRDYDEFDRENLSASLAAKHALSQRLTLGLEGTIKRDHTFLSALEETGAVVEKTPRRSRNGQIQGEYRLDERTGLRLFAGAYDVAHSVNQGRDNHGNSLGASLSRDLDDARLRLILEGETRRHAYATGDQRMSGLLAGPMWRASETLTAKLLAGAQTVRTDLNDNGGPQTDLHPALDMDLSWKGERAGVSLRVLREQTSGSGGENIERTRVIPGATWDFTQRLQGILTASLLHAESEGYRNPSKNRSFSLRPALRYELEDGYLQMAYTYKANENLFTHEYHHGNRVELQMVFEFPNIF